jgi:hypothetical protein
LQHFKKHQILLFFWFILFGFISGFIGRRFGITYLFLDPEYLGKVNFYSFFIVGFATGGFIMIWQITSYILHGWRFPFLAAVREPFIKFCLNNTILPIVFIMANVYEIIHFQRQIESKTSFELLIHLVGYFSGLLLIIMITNTYFFSTNRNVLSWVSKDKLKRNKTKAARLNFGTFETDKETRLIKVDYYLSSPIRIRHTRNVEHYDKKILQHVYKQHYFNSLFIEISTIFILIGLSTLMDYPYFRIPAAASVLLLFAVITIIVGAFSYWLRGWRTTIFILLFVVINFLSQYNFFNYRNRIYGLKYTAEKVNYTAPTLLKMCTKSQVEQDRNSTLQSLNAWRSKFKGPNKPYLFFVNVSGGGSRSALWSFSVLQHLDSLMNGQLMPQTMLISGASGGMLGAAYFRELYYKSLTTPFSLNNRQFNANISLDLLNAVTTSIAVNDVFIPWIPFQYANQTYKKDRAYAFENQLNDNTNNLLDKHLCDYRLPERNALIPWMIINGTIINDGRILMVSPQPISYLCKPNNTNTELADSKIDAVDYHALFAKQGADSSRFSSLLRMNCTFPYILPNVTLPSLPKLEVMDAGIRDNYGFETSTRFISTFKDWIDENTAGVVLVQITDFNRSNMELEDNEQTSFEELTNPITNVFYNFPEFQYFHQNTQINLLSQSLKTKMRVFRFEYTPESIRDRASLSFHLTYKEKTSIHDALHNAANQSLFSGILNLLNSKYITNQ